MSRTIAAVCARLIPVPACLALLVWSPFAWPGARLGNAEACVAGASAGALLFAVLARRWRLPPLRRVAGIAAPSLALTAVSEEAVWRYAAQGFLSPLIGVVAALAASTVLFAVVHVPTLGRRALKSHLLSGATFGSLYVGTGRLVAAILAHLVYNVLVVAAATCWPQPVDRIEVAS
jgi:membrane protease YdiL (CAAX protease family)